MSSSVRGELRELGVCPRRSRGQSFLVSRKARSVILSFAAVDANDSVLEIGPGLGALTGALLSTARRLHVVEVEEEFCLRLARLFPALADNGIICSDFRDLDLGGRCCGSSEKLVVVANLPYSRSTDAVFWLFSNRVFVRRAVLLLQREFAERLAAGPGTRKYGTISVERALWADARLGSVLGGGAFHPRAGVESRLVELLFLEEPRADVGDEVLFRRLVRGVFSYRRKTLENSLAMSGIVASKGEARTLLGRVGINGGRRPEMLSLDELAALGRTIAQVMVKE